MQRRPIDCVILAASLSALVSVSCSEQGPPAQPSDPDGATRDVDGPAADSVAAPAALSTAELRRVVTRLASDELAGRDEGTPGSAKARAFIISELKRCGVDPAGDGGSFEQRITTGKGTNILGLIKGTGPTESRRTVIISAHYDHLGACGGAICNGAYDNAAGVALVLAAACELAKSPPRRSVLVAAWDAEEPPTFLGNAMGSRFYVEHPRVPLAETDVVIVLDLVGSEAWKGYNGHFALGAELSSQIAGELDAVAAPAGLQVLRLGLHLPEQTPLGLQPWSDYHFFRQQKVPVLFLSDGYNKRYHGADDEVALLRLDKMTLEARYLHAVVSRVANVAASGYLAPTFQAAGADYLLDATNAEKVLSAALAQGALAEGLGAASKQKLHTDLARVRGVKAKLSAGAKAGAADIAVLRTAVQRAMCLSGPLYPESVCNMM